MIQVRPLRPDGVEERDAVARLTVGAYDDVGRVSEDYRERLADVGERLDGESRILVAVQDEDVLGAVTVVSARSEHFEHRGHGDGGFRMLAVAPAAQGRGVGRALLEAVLAHARRCGWRRLAITTMEWMHTAQRMYESSGFLRRADLDVRFASGIGICYVLDLTADAAEHFPAPGPVPDEPPLFVPRDDQPPGC